MSKKVRDTDYLFLSARIASLERTFLTKSRMERMLQAATLEECAQVLSEIGYPDFDVASESSLHRALAQERTKIFRELDGMLPDAALFDVFKLKYDYHNVKTVIKSRGADVTELLLDAGRISPRELTGKYLQRGKWDFLPGEMNTAAEEATRVLYETGDPQRSDFVMDRAYYAEMLTLAKGSRCEYLVNYVRTMIDAANLRDLVRTLRMHQPGTFLQQVLFDGGMVRVEQILSGVSGGVAALYRSTPLAEAAELGEIAVSGGRLTGFERALDNAVLRMAAAARRIPFGVEVVIGYLAARENELTNARVIMAGRMAGIGADTIRERLRDCYV